MNLSSEEQLTILSSIDDLRHGGSLWQHLPGYQERPAQIEMAGLVCQALIEGRHALLEAGTGTGKTHSYLAPIARSGKVTVISTANKALQEQLFYKDIPFVQQHIQDFAAALIKGIGNYICLDRMEEERVEVQHLLRNPEFERLQAVVESKNPDFTGDFETLGFQLPVDLRGRIAGDSDRCAWQKCDFYSQCFIRRMRDLGNAARVIVVNHTLLLLDAAAEGAILPEHDFVVLDEAHTVEEEATRVFTLTIKPSQVFTLLALRSVREHSPANLQDQVTLAAGDVWQLLEQMVPASGGANRVVLLKPIESGLRLASLLTDLASALRQQKPGMLTEKEEALYEKLVKRVQNLAANVHAVFSVDQPGRSFVYYIERVYTQGQRGSIVEVSAAPLDVAPWLRDKLFGKWTVIGTSATLASVESGCARSQQESGPNFAYFKKRVGLDHPASPDMGEPIEVVLPLAFDYRRNSLLYVPRGLPEPAYGAGPGVQAYQQAIADEIVKLVTASRGRAFLLFSSKKMLDTVFALTASRLHYPLLRQGDMPRIALTRQFREEKGAVLFGLKSFWEGVDIAGEALSLVVIDKLPFDPPVLCRVMIPASPYKSANI
jgi:Rad3-related DNA helicase